MQVNNQKEIELNGKKKEKNKLFGIERILILILILFHCLDFIR